MHLHSLEKDSSKMETAFKAEEKPIKSSFILFVLEMRVYGCGYGCQMVYECVSGKLCDIYQHADNVFKGPAQDFSACIRGGRLGKRQNWARKDGPTVISPSA